MGEKNLRSEPALERAQLGHRRKVDRVLRLAREHQRDEAVEGSVRCRPSCTHKIRLHTWGNMWLTYGCGECGRRKVGAA